MNNMQFRDADDKGLLLPFLVGAAVAFPIGYIASNTNKSNQNYQQPYYQMPYPPMYQPYPPMPYYSYYPR